MPNLIFNKPFTQQEPIPQNAIERVIELLQSGRLHRYNVVDGEIAEASLLEAEFAHYMNQSYCLACTSGGYALHIALKAAGVKRGEKVLTNGFTLAPVPGAIHHAGGEPIFVEIDANYCVDLTHLEQLIIATKARFFLISHMRGHIADMDAVSSLCQHHNVLLIEDCAHTMGARWGQKKSGCFGAIACFSTQTYKHLNSGEGGLLTTDNAQFIAKAVLYSGSYMLFERHGAIPESAVFDDIKLDIPNYSGRMDNLRAAILRAQLPLLETNGERWNQRYYRLCERLQHNQHITLPRRPLEEAFIASSLQFRVESFTTQAAQFFVDQCRQRGVELKWFGANMPHGFTSRYDSWRYVGTNQHLPNTLEILATTFDLRIPLTFTLDDMKVIGDIINEVVELTLKT